MNLIPARTTDFLIQLNFLLKCSPPASLRLLKWFISASTAHLQLSYELEDVQIFVNMYVPGTLGSKIMSIRMNNQSKFYWIKPSLHNKIDSCYSTTGYISNMFRPCLVIIRLTKVQLNYIMLLYRWDPIGTATLCTLIDTNLCKPDDGQTRPKHAADVTSCRITTINRVV